MVLSVGEKVGLLGRGDAEGCVDNVGLEVDGLAVGYPHEVPIDTVSLKPNFAPSWMSSPSTRIS